MAIENIDQIVEKLIGPVQPIGCSNADAERFENLKCMVDLHEWIIEQLVDAANNADRHEASMKKIGEYAAVHLGSFCNDLKEDV